MITLVVTAPDRYELREVPIPTPEAGQVLMRIDAVTTCPQWDLHLRHNEPMFVGHKFDYPYTAGQPGHEAVGTIEAVGAGVSELKPGDRVAAWKDQGHTVPGCYAQFVIHRAENVVKVRSDLPAEALAPLELAMCVGTVFRMLVRMEVLAGRRVGVSGLGPAGIIAAQMARAEGAAEVVGFDLVEERRSFAVKHGCHRCVDPATADLPVRPAKPLGLDTSIDCVGARASAEFLMDRTDDVVALFGVQREDFTYAVRHHTLRLCGYRGHHRESADYALSLIEAGALDLASLVTVSLPLSRYGEGIDLLEQRKAMKVCFRPWDA
jgi:threonine dehydrogenase-like Zn-dependent dehydrogenase